MNLHRRLSQRNARYTESGTIALTVCAKNSIDASNRRFKCLVILLFRLGGSPCKQFQGLLFRNQGLIVLVEYRFKLPVLVKTLQKNTAALLNLKRTF